MLLVKKCNDFHYLFLLKIGPEIRFNNIMNRKETFLNYKDKIFTTSQKWHFSKGVKPMLLVKKCNFFSLFVFARNKTRVKG